MLEQEIKTLTEIESALPEAMPFYHLGEVRLSEEILPTQKELAEMEVLGFSFQGDLRGLMLVLFDPGLDASVYAEMGNLIAANTATRLSRERALDVLISPPKKLETALVSKIIDQGSMIIHRTYLHVHQGKSVPVQTWILPYTGTEVVGHA
jgi:hypothetical protein